MEKELDLSGVDDILAEDSQEEELDLSGVDEILAKPSLLDRAITRGQELLTPSQFTQDVVGGALESGQDFSVGAAKGLTMGSLDELGGLVGAGVESGLGALGIGPSAVDEQLAEQGFQGVDESFLAKYRGYQEASEQAVKDAEARSPILSTAGQIAGGITGGVALGGLMGLGQAGAKAKSIAEIARNDGMSKAALELLKRGGINYAKASPAIAAESALTSEADLIGPNAQPMKVAADVAGGLAFGLPAVMGLQAASDVIAPAAMKSAGAIKGKLAEIAEDSPIMRQMEIAYNKYGKNLKVNPKSEKAILEGVPGVEGGTPFSLLDTKRAENITKQVLDVDEELGKLVGKSIDDAKGVTIDVSKFKQDTYDEVLALSQEMPSILKDENFNKIITKVLSRDFKNASPRDIKNTMDDITNAIERIGSYKIPSPELEEAPKLLRKLRTRLDVTLKDTLPEYELASTRFAQHRNAYLEQPIAGRFDPELDDIYYGSMKKGDKKITEAYEDLVKRTTSDSQSADATEARYSKLGEATKKFQAAEDARVAAGQIKAPITADPKVMLDQIKSFADDAAVRRTTRKTQESQAGGAASLKSIVGMGDTGRGFALSTAYRAGRIAASKPVTGTANIGRKLYNAPTQSLNTLATKIEATPGLAPLGKALREGIESGNANKKNAALFTIMQNPNARLLISAEDIQDDETLE